MYLTLARHRGVPRRRLGALLRRFATIAPLEGPPAPPLAGGCVSVGSGVCRELVSIATVRLADSVPGDEVRWATTAATLRDCSPGALDRAERVQLPSDVDVCVQLAVLLDQRAARGRLLHCSHQAAELAVKRIFADVARRQIGLLG